MGICPFSLNPKTTFQDASLRLPEKKPSPDLILQVLQIPEIPED